MEETLYNSPSEGGLTIQARDEINDQLKNTFDDLVDYKFQAEKQEKIIKEQKNIIEKYKDKNNLLKNEVKDKRIQMNAVLNLFEITDQISFEDLKKIISNWKEKENLYGEISKVFNKNPSENINFKDSIIDLQKNIEEQQNELDKVKEESKKVKEEAEKAINELEDKNRELKNREKGFAKLLSTEAENLNASIRNLIKDKTELTEQNAEKDSEISNMNEEIERRNNFKKEVIQQLNAGSEGYILNNIKKLKENNEVLKKVADSVGCDPLDTQKVIETTLSNIKNLEAEKAKITSALGVPASTIVAAVTDLIEKKKLMEDEINELNQENQKMKGDIYSYEAQNREHNDSHREKDLVIENNSRDIEKFRAQIAKQAAKISQLEEEKEEVEAQLATTNSKLQQNENLKDMLQKEFNSSKEHSNSVVENLVADNKTKTDEINNLNAELGKTKRLQKQLQEKLQNIEEQNEANQNEANETKEEFRKLQKELNEKHNETNRIKLSLETSEKENKTLKAKLQQVENSYSLLQSEHDSYMKISEDSVAKVAKGSSEKEKEIHEIKAKLLEALRNKESAETAKQRLENELQSQKQTSKEITDELKEDIANKTEEISKANAELIKTRSLNENLQRQLKEKETENQTLHEQHEFEKSNLKESSDKIHNENTEKRNEIANLNAKIADLEREKAESIVKINTLQSQVDQNASIQQMMQSKYEEADKHANELLERIAKESTEKSKEIASLKLEILSISSQNEVANSEIEDLNAKLEQIEQQKDSIIEEMEENKQNNEKTISELTLDTQTKAKDISTLKNEVSEKDVRISELTTEVQNMKLSMDAITAKLNHKDATINQQQQEMEEQKEQISSLLSQMSQDKQDTVKELQTLKKDNSNKNNRIETLSEEIKAVKESAKQTSEKQNLEIQKLTSKNETLLEKLNQTTNDLQEAKENNEELTDKVQSMEKTIAEQTKLIKSRNISLENNSKEVSEMQKEIEKMKLEHEEKIANITNSCNTQISDIKSQHIKDISLIAQEKNEAIIKTRENSQKEISQIADATQQQVNEIVANSKKIIADKQNEVIELNKKHQQEIIDIQEQKRKEIELLNSQKAEKISQLLAEKEKEETEFAKKEENFTRQISELTAENDQLKSKIESFGGQIVQTSKELSKIQTEFESRSKIYDKSVSYHKGSMNKIREILGIEKSASTEDVINTVEKLMKNYAKQQIEICNALDIPRNSPTKFIKERIEDLNVQSNTVTSISEELGMDLTPEALRERMNILHSTVHSVQSRLRKKEKEMSRIATQLNVSNVSEIPEKINFVLRENEKLQSELDESLLYSRSMAQTLGCDEDDLDKTVEDVYKDKRTLERAHQKLAELVGVEESFDSASVVYERVQSLKKTHDELSTILGTEDVQNSVESLKKQNDELLTIFTPEDEDESLVYTAGLAKRTLIELEKENRKLATQQSQLCDIMNVSSIKDLNRTVKKLKKENESLMSEEIENATLREQVADIIDDADIDSTANSSILQAVQRLKEEKQNLSTELSDQSKLFGTALGIKGRTPEAITKSIITLKKKQRANEDVIHKMQETLFSICKMLNIEFTTEKSTFGEIEIAIGGILHSNELLRDQIGEVVGLSPALRDPKTISREVKRIFSRAKEAEKMKKVVGELEASKQEMQRLVYRPKTTAVTQTEPLENESLPIIQRQATELRKYEKQLMEQEKELGSNNEEIGILRNSLKDIYSSLGKHVGTPREAMREIGQIKIENKELSRAVLEAKNVPVSHSSLTSFQHAQIATLRATSEKLYSQSKAIKSETPKRTPRTPQSSKYSDSHKSVTPIVRKYH